MRVQTSTGGSSSTPQRPSVVSPFINHLCANQISIQNAGSIPIITRCPIRGIYLGSQHSCCHRHNAQHSCSHRSLSQRCICSRTETRNRTGRPSQHPKGTQCYHKDRLGKYLQDSLHHKCLHQCISLECITLQRLFSYYNEINLVVFKSPYCTRLLLRYLCKAVRLRIQI